MANSFYKIVKKKLIGCKSGGKIFIAKHLEGGNVKLIIKKITNLICLWVPHLKIIVNPSL
jgi:hypothetical protein